MEIDERANGVTWRWSLLLSVVFLNICLPSLLLSYGVFWVHLSNLDFPVWLGLSTPTIFVFTHGVTQCWFREAADSWGGTIGYRFMATMGLIIVVASLLTCAFIPLSLQPVIYGIFGGIGSSLVSAQIDAVIFETYDARATMVRGMCFTGQAVAQSLFPHIITVLIDYYGYSVSFIIISAIMLQAMPAVLLLKVDDNIRRSSLYNADFYKTYTVFRNDAIENYYTAEVQLHDLSKKCWKSPSDDNLHREEEITDEDVEIVGTITPPPSPEERRRNIFGVEILPDIPEESEESDEEGEKYDSEKDVAQKKQRLSNAIKRLSTLGDNLDDFITKQIRRDSEGGCSAKDNREYAELEVIYDNISPITDIHTEKLFNSFSFRCHSTYANIKRRICIPSYRVYRIRRRLLYLMYNINDTFFKPLTRSLSCWRFYPALLLYFSKHCLTAVSLTTLPMIAQQVQPKIDMFETNFLMSLHGFTWICFLLCTPWLTQTPKRNFKYVVVFGLVIATAASFAGTGKAYILVFSGFLWYIFADIAKMFAEASNHDSFAIGCVVLGLGYGAITSCWETAAQDFVGARKWPKFQSTLETLSSFLLVLFVVGLSFIVKQEGGFQYSMFLIGIIMAVITITWLIFALMALYDTKLRYLRPRKRWFF